MISDGRPPEQIKSFLKMDDAEYDAITTTELFNWRLTYLQKKANHQEPLPKTPDEIMAFAVRGLVKLSKSAAKDGDKVKSLAELGGLAANLQKNAPQQAPTVQSADADLLTILNKKENDA